MRKNLSALLIVVVLLLFGFSVAKSQITTETSKSFSTKESMKSDCICSDLLKNSLDDDFFLRFQKSLYQSIIDKNLDNILRHFTNNALLVTLDGNSTFKEQFQPDIFQHFSLLKYEILDLQSYKISNSAYLVFYKIIKVYNDKNEVFVVYNVHGSLITNEDGCWKIKFNQMTTVPPRLIDDILNNKIKGGSIQ